MKECKKHPWLFLSAFGCAMTISELVSNTLLSTLLHTASVVILHFINNRQTNCIWHTPNDGRSEACSKLNMYSLSSFYIAIPEFLQ
jgi:hypothetical protein